MKDLILSMTSASPMVHYAVLAFSVIQIHRKDLFSEFYMQSQEEVSSSLTNLQADPDEWLLKVQHLLAALFLLSYVDLVTDRTHSAHINLRKAYDIVSKLKKESLSSSEKRLISWIRLLDARAVSAGGEGLFLREDGDAHDQSGVQSPSVDDAEATISDILSKPALSFFQKTQSFMGRITQIDPWHRSRGTVDGETEVMAIAAKIRTDNHKLYSHRTPLLDLAVSGSLGPPLIAERLASSITRSSRMALSNYHATFIHLHRVAYRSLPRTIEVHNAMNAIRQMTKNMVEAQEPEDSLPVNILWPLLIWDSEEELPQERDWVITTIRSMTSEVSNARITADVLEEAWKRQDAEGQRFDIRTVMHETFNSCFAIV